MFLLKISEYENFLKKKLSLKEELDLKVFSLLNKEYFFFVFIKINELQERNDIFSTLSSERKHKIFIDLFSNKEQDTDKAFAKIFETFLNIQVTQSHYLTYLLFFNRAYQLIKLRGKEKIYLGLKI